MGKQKCPQCGSTKIEKIEYNDKNEAIVRGVAVGAGSGLATAGVVGVATVGKLALGAKILGIVTAACGPIAPAVAIPAAIVIGGTLAASKAYSKVKTKYKCNKCKHEFE